MLILIDFWQWFARRARWQRCLLLVLGFVICGALGYLGYQYYQGSPATSALAPAVSKQPAEQSVATGTAASQPATLTVAIDGEITRAGVYQLPAGSRVTQLVTAGGGATVQADTQQLNLAQKLVDGQKVTVPRQGVPRQAPATSPDQSAVTDSVNLNLATVKDFQTLEGIGERKAQQIVAYREAHGLFQSVDDLKKVPGIGQRRFDALKARISV